uniref:Uncharacterized protein n=1 Tax=Octopus bimaculoides TaxID=37653 RepID=A0A0L8G8N1_OCTBM
MLRKRRWRVQYEVNDKETENSEGGRGKARKGKRLKLSLTRNGKGQRKEKPPEKVLEKIIKRCKRENGV